MQAYLKRKSLHCNWFAALNRFLAAKPRSLLGLVGSSVLITTLLLWQALIAQEKAYIH